MTEQEMVQFQADAAKRFRENALTIEMQEEKIKLLVGQLADAEIMRVLLNYKIGEESLDTTILTIQKCFNKKYQST